MKQQLLKKLNPIIETFADDILAGFGDLSQIRKDLINDKRKYEDLNESKIVELNQIKEQKTLNRREYDKKITEFENAKSNYAQKAKDYEDLTNDLKAKKQRTEDNLAKSEIELVRAKDVRVQADDTKITIDKMKSDYQLKLNSLRADTDKIDSANKEIASDRIKLTARENDIFKNETKNGQRTQELNDLDKKIKAERVEVDRLIKHYKLKL